MTYSLNTLNSQNSSDQRPRTGFGRFLTELGLIGGFVLLVLWLLALTSL